MKKLNLTMLYVEDEADTRERLSEVFKHKVQTLYVAKDGKEALELFKKHQINFIVSDFNMPNMNGIELCNAVKKINRHIFFTLLTAFDDFELLTNAIDAHVDKFLKKPVNAKKLFQTLDNIYEKIENEFQLERSTVCLQEAEKIANLAYWDVNLSKKEIHFSKEVYELFNLKEPLNHIELSKIIVDDYKDKFLDIFNTKIFTEENIDEIISICDKNSQLKYFKVTAKRWKSSICGKWHLIGIFQDITHFELQRLELLKESQSDPMLKISNKKRISSQLEDLIKSSKRYGHPIGVIFFDIDNFKGINDKYGHLAADCILVQLAQLIQKNIRQSDFFGRWGGDEFIIINSHTNPDAVITLTNKILEKIKEFNWEKNINLTISAGLSFYEAGDNVKSLIHRADLKMIDAKNSGKNRYVH
ncbi:MAG: diguanylate cyclase [Campylobacterota bacterium]|nr:diguanylate cyclase [Campylobacterota bacterium]